MFCAYVGFVFIGLAFLVRDVGEDVPGPSEQLHGLTAAILILVTFAGLIAVAVHQVRKRRSTQSLC